MTPHHSLDCSVGLSFCAMWYKALIAFMLNKGGFLSAGTERHQSDTNLITGWLVWVSEGLKLPFTTDEKQKKYPTVISKHYWCNKTSQSLCQGKQILNLSFPVKVTFSCCYIFIDTIEVAWWYTISTSTTQQVKITVDSILAHGCEVDKVKTHRIKHCMNVWLNVGCRLKCFECSTRLEN